jgi:hypothetical protein
MSPAVSRSRPLAAASRWRGGCFPVSAANASRCARRVGQVGSVVSPGRYWSAWSSSATVWGQSGHIADMDPAVIKVEVEPRRVALAEGKRRCRFGGVGEAVQLGQAEGAVGLGDVAEDAAGADRGKLLIITHQPDTRTSIDGELHGRVEGEGVGHASFIDDDQR